ncbi:MAG: AbiEi antitoxin N-terminal domain-containing protein, partial [Candidatus Nanopelagicaceae bacterium]|nr:AbiEi antitoxin N-terminal domain-containing protein [Candidatus Nanopelagicaceae bacterium]
LINGLLRSVRHDQPLDLKTLANHGVSAALAAHYSRTGWLTRLGPGVYAFPGGRLDRDQCLLFLQGRTDGLHVGGKTALAWQGVTHYLSTVETLSLWGVEKTTLPSWFISQFPSSYRSWALLNNKVAGRGLFTPPELTPHVKVSERERALLELLRDIRTEVDLEEARHLFFATKGMRIKNAGELLEGCTNVRTVRLFLMWGHESDNIDVGQLRAKYILPTGSPSRWIGKLADGTKLVLPA